MQFLRIAYETKADRAQRLQRNRQEKDFRHAKLERTRHKGAHDDVELANFYRMLGLDYFYVSKDESRTAYIKRVLTGLRVDRFPKPALKWLKENYDATEARDPEGRLVIQFLEPESQGEAMKLYSQLAESSEEPRKAVKNVYEALIKHVRHELRHERRVRLPELGIISIRFRPAKEKRRGRNPATGQEMWFKPKPASNKLRFSPTKDFKVYIAEKIAVVEPKKKHKKEKHHSKHKHHRKH